LRAALRATPDKLEVDPLIRRIGAIVTAIADHCLPRPHAVGNHPLGKHW
jgi:hypothetical protein